MMIPGVKPYYQSPDGKIVLYCGDCLPIMNEMSPCSIDISVTSPPYNTLPTNHKPSGLHGERRSGVNQWIKRASKGYPDSVPEDNYQSWLRNRLQAAYRVTSGLLWVNHKVRYRDGEAIHPLRFLPFPLYSEVIWDRGVSMALNCKRYAPSHEALWAFGRPTYWSDTLNTLMSVWRLPADRGRDDHPCAFPVQIALRPISSSCRPDGMVLDPFLGSGTTAVACVKTGRKCIGIEIEERYCEIAAKRIQQAIDDQALFAGLPEPESKTEPMLYSESDEGLDP